MIGNQILQSLGRTLGLVTETPRLGVLQSKVFFMQYEYSTLTVFNMHFGVFFLQGPHPSLSGILPGTCCVRPLCFLVYLIFKIDQKDYILSTSLNFETKQLPCLFWIKLLLSCILHCDGICLSRKESQNKCFLLYVAGLLCLITAEKKLIIQATFLLPPLLSDAETRGIQHVWRGILFSSVIKSSIMSS